MPNRMIRDGILESEAVLSLPAEARWLYVSVLLSADDIGLFEATPFKLARRADVRRELADKLVQMLADADLVRLYQVDGKRYGFIPRFGQRLQIKRIKHAAPPDALLSDEPETLKKIKDLAIKTTVDHGCASAGQRKTTAAQPPEPEPEPEVEEIQTTSVVKGRPSTQAECPHSEILKLWAQYMPAARQPAEWTPARQTLLRTRWRESPKRQSLEWWARFFGYVAKSEFLTGQVSTPGRKPFEISLDWLLKSEHFLKTIEGGYHNEVTA